MATKALRLRRRDDGYYVTQWVGPDGKRRTRTFGNIFDLAQQRFTEFASAWATDPKVRGLTPESVTFSQGWEHFLEEMDAHYRRPDGSRSSSLAGVRSGYLAFAGRLGDLPIHSIRVEDILAARIELAESGLARLTINAYVGHVGMLWKFFFSKRWAEQQETERIRGIRAVSSGRALRRSDGETITPVDYAPVRAVPDAYVTQVAEALDADGYESIARLIRLLDATGMRPGEGLSIRAIDIDMSGAAWVYRPARHKTERHQARAVHIGPRGQELIRPLLTNDTSRPLFDLKYDNTGRVVRATCERLGIPAWSLNQLRHNAATRLRAKFGIEVAKAALGHRNASTTEIYAERDFELARKAVLDCG